MSARPISSDAADPSAEPWSGMAVSLTFWLLLLAAAVLFAFVSLSPKALAYLTLWDQFQSQQEELVQLEQQQAELNRVIAALNDDPQFAAEMARLEFDAVRPGEEILTVESSLALEPHAVHELPAGRSEKHSAWRPWIAAAVQSQSLRRGCLLAAAMLVIIAFGWMHERAGT
jgi:cell division protein FtsB